MANVYVRSGAGGAATGADWANAYLTLAAALAAKAAGDDFWVSEDHAESTAGAVAITSPGTATAPCRIICVNHAGSVPPVSADLATTGSVATSGANSISFAGFAYCYGLTFSAASAANNGSISFAPNAAFWWRLESCLLKLNTTGTSSRITIGDSSTSALAERVELVNTPLQFGSTSHIVRLTGSELLWKKTANAIAGTVPTTLVVALGISSYRFDCIGVDLSAAGSGNNLVDASIANRGRVTFTDCKLGSSVAITTGNVSSQAGAEVRLVNCDSANTNYRYYKQTYQGTITHETTIVANATDGTTKRSLKMVSTANSKFYSPLESDWMLFWNTSTGGALTVAIPVVTDNVTLKDNDAWIEVEGLGTASFPLGTFSSDAAADVLNTGTNQTTDATTSWTTTGLVTPVKQVLSTTIAPQSAGFIRVRVCLAKATTTMYFDPAPVNGSFTLYKATQYMAAGADGMFGEQSAGGGSAGGGSIIGSPIVQGTGRVA